MDQQDPRLSGGRSSWIHCLGYILANTWVSCPSVATAPGSQEEASGFRVQYGVMKEGRRQPRAREGPACLTLGTEGLATEVALEGLLACVRAQVHVEIGLLGEGVAAELTDVWPLIPVQAGTQASPKEAVPLVPLQLGTHLIPEPRKQARLRPACLSCENRLGLPGEKRA